MNKKCKMISVVLVILTLIVLFPATAFAEFGIQDEVSFWIHATEFTQAENPGFRMNTRGYIYPVEYADFTNGTKFYAPLHVPNGVDVTSTVFYYMHDQGLTASEIVFTWQYSRDNEPFGDIDSSVSEPQGSVVGNNHLGTVDLGSIPIDNRDMYRFVVEVPPIPDDVNLHLLGFKGVKVSYRRQASVPPSVATFSDVNPSMQFFPYVEALAAAGITTGYGDGTFKPNDYVTRGQMAAFLTRALGLHHPAQD